VARLRRNDSTLSETGLEDLQCLSVLSLNDAESSSCISPRVRISQFHFSRHVNIIVGTLSVLLALALAFFLHFLAAAIFPFLCSLVDDTHARRASEFIFVFSVFVFRL